MIAFETEIGTVTPLGANRSSSTNVLNPLAPDRVRWRRFSVAALTEAITSRLPRNKPVLDIPEAVGATDRELARLGPDPSRRVHEMTRNANQRLLDLTVMPYR
jgi:hypothetical protein